MIEPDVALVACRFAFFGAAMFLWGSSACLAVVVPDRLSRFLAAKQRVCVLGAVVTVVVATALLLPLRATSIGSGWQDFSNPDTLSALLFETDIGAAWMAQAAAAILLSVAVIPFGRMQTARIALAAALALATQPLTGHAAMNPGALGAFHRANDTLHLLAAGAWIGALAPVMLLLFELRRPEFCDEAMEALARFSRAGHVAVAVTIGTGLINTYLVVGGLPVTGSVLYQRLLALKIVFVATMITLAVSNRYLLVPRYPKSLPALVRGTLAEGVLAGAVLLLVAWLGILDPFAVD